MIKITTPISMMPSVEPISDAPSAGGVGVVCWNVNEDVWPCADAKDWVKFALVSTKTSSRNIKASPKTYIVFIFIDCNCITAKSI